MSEQLFIKLMMMTTSSHDGEVLTAIRKANAILAGQNLNWEEFIMQMASTPAPERGKTEANGHTEEWSDVRGSEKPKRRPSKPDPKATRYGGPGVDQAFDRVMRDVTGTFKNFIEDVHEFYQINGYITQRQYDALKKAYDMRKGR